MVDRRLEFHEMLCEVLNITGEPDGDRHVYFQPPESLKMKYEAIRYSRKNIPSMYANNLVYKNKICYEVILISRDPDSKYISRLLLLPYSSYDRHYVADNLHHDVFTIYH